MDQLSFLGSDEAVLSVGELNRYVRSLLESDYRLQDIWVAGEISNLARPASGHLYFTLKDEGASLRCVMWRSEVARQTILPQDGRAAEVHGHISVYEAGGQYQLYVDRVRPAGEGELYRRFLELKSTLEAEGLFEEARKRPLPEFPKRIGLVTSEAAAALQDVLDVLARRFPLAEVLLVPSPVQGAEAPASIVRALERLARLTELDVILLVRGGGSLEDLASFNDERVARAIAECPIPVVTGVGHETDFTIADFVADVRAPTPSAAAELASPNRADLTADVAALSRALMRAFSDLLAEYRWRLQRSRSALRLASPKAQLANARQRVDELQHRGVAAMRHGLRLRRSELNGLRSALRAVGPAAVLGRGYALVRDGEGAVVRSIEQVSIEELVQVHLADGEFSSRVERIEPSSDAEDGGEELG